MSDWIAVTVRGGFAKFVRANTVTGFGKHFGNEGETSYIDYQGRVLEVEETVDQLKTLLVE